MRCFIAIELPEETKAALVTAGPLVGELDAGWVGEKWVAASVLHVTLRFLGDLDRPRIDSLAEAFAMSAAEIAPFQLHLSELIAVPRATRASMVWATVVDPSGRCADLAVAAEGAATAVGIERSKHVFTPHVTLARARRPKPLSATALLDVAERIEMRSWPSVSVPSATLFSSTLTPSGPVHVHLAEFALGVR